MSKKNEFIRFVDERLMSKLSNEEIPEEVALYWDAFKMIEEVEKPPLTENGKKVLAFLQTQPSDTLWKSRDIAEQMGITSRTVSGTMRKLTSDGFVDKIGQEPVIYKITNKGKEFIIDTEN